MEARSVQRNHRLVFSAMSAAIGICALITALATSLYESPAGVVLVATVLCVWSGVLITSNKFADYPFARIVTVAIANVLTVVMTATAHDASLNTTYALVVIASALIVAVSATQHEELFSFGALVATVIALFAAMAITQSISRQPVASALTIVLLSFEFYLIRHIHIPVVASLNEALDRAEIFSTITKSSREFHSREPEEAIRNIVNVTKTLGYISVSVVSFDRRQKIFEDGVPIPNVMDIAVRASATRRVTITEDQHTSRNPRSRHGDIVGVPIWINGRYSAALIVQTSPTAKVTQRDCEALELLADQAGRALENAGKAAMDRRVVERLTDESQRDKLTGLGNRRFADQMVASMKVGDVLAMIDLDGLKSTNDVYGHSSGDELLHEVGVFLTEQIRNPDMAARLGGDEFMILIRNAQDGAPAILERLLKLWEARKLYDTTFSIGMAEHRHDKTARETVEAADSALYQAKKQGKNRLVTAVAS